MLGRVGLPDFRARTLNEILLYIRLKFMEEKVIELKVSNKYLNVCYNVFYNFIYKFCNFIL